MKNTIEDTKGTVTHFFVNIVADFIDMVDRVGDNLL